MAMTEAEKKAAADARAAAKQEVEALSETLGTLEIHPVTGVALDTEDPNYAQLKRIEDLKADVVEARNTATDVGLKQDSKVAQAQLDAEEARLKAELAQARAAANIGDGSGGGVDSILAQVEEQRRQAETAEAAAKTEGNN